MTTESMGRTASTVADFESWLIPVYNAGLIVEEAVRQGVDRRELVRGTGISLKDLQNGDTLKSHKQIVALFERTLRLYPLPGLGLRVGRDETPVQWGILGFAVMCCKRLREVIAMLIKYHRVAASMAEFYFEEAGDLATLECRPPDALHGALVVVVEEHLSAIWAAARILTGRRDLRPTSVHFSYAAPSYARMYREVFGCPVYFNQPSNKLQFERAFLDLPVLHSSTLSAQMAERICERQLRRQISDHDLLHQVRHFLLARPGSFPDAEQVAEMLNITSRTLRNRLRELGTSFQAILDDVRHHLAVNYLEQSELALADVSALVGFNDVSNFRRAFKKWTGKNPSEVRRRALEGAVEP